MADRHFDLNKAIADAQVDQDEPRSRWLTFDLGKNYVPFTRTVTGDDGEEREVPNDGDDPVREPWRIDRDSIAGWTVMQWVATTSNVEQMGLTMRLVREAIDPEQWPQFQQLLVDEKLPMPQLEMVVQLIVRDQLGLPLDL